MTGIFALLAFGGMQAAQPAAAGPSMVVTQEQFASALAVCRDQIARPHFAPDEVAGKGWPKVMSQESDGTAPSVLVYRHPENMLLLGFRDSPAGSDECIIMAPTGPTLDIARARAGIAALAGAKASEPRNQSSWRIDEAEVRLEPMASGGVRVVFAQKERK